MPKPVLHVYAGNLYGGIETLLRTLAEYPVADARLRPQFALCFEGQLGQELQAAGAVVHHLGEVRFRRPWTVLRARRRLARTIAAADPSTVICHACWPYALAAPVVRRWDRPLVFWMHDQFDSQHPTWIDRLAARTRPDLVLANSQGTAEGLPKFFPGVPFEVLYCPVAPPPPIADPAADRAAMRRELNTPVDATVIVQASRMERWKGHAVLIAALGLLRNHPDWVAWIVGGAQRPHEVDYVTELRTQAAALGVADRVWFAGQRRDVHRLLAAADVYCQPNTGPEPFGIAFIEALYAGRPVVATRLGGSLEIVSPDCGILVEPANPVALAGTLGRLIADVGLRAQLGAAGPLRARALCDPVAVRARLEKLLRVAGGPGRGG